MSTQVAGHVYEFGIRDRFRAAREQAGLDQAQLAELTGLSRQSVSNYERGVTTPRRPAAMAWAVATGFDLTWLLTGATPEPDGGHENGPISLADRALSRARRDSNPQPSDMAFAVAA